jgi:colanic acid/amylovoran biosynthesis glycosyltransferase
MAINPTTNSIAATGSARKIAYLVSQYPAINHTYILREIRELRRQGWAIEVASVRPDTRGVATVTAEEREERGRTWYVKSQGALRVVWAHVVCAASSPVSYFSGLRCAGKLGGFAPGRLVQNFFYFTEALLVGLWMQRKDLTHVHVHFSSTVGLLVAKSFPVTVSHSIHGPAEFVDPVGFHLKDKIGAARFVCAISRYGRGQLMKACEEDQWEKLETVPLGIDPKEFAPGAGGPSKEGEFTVLSVGRLSPEKSQATLIEAVARLVAEGRRLRLRLVGDGLERPALEAKIAAERLGERVRLEGNLNQDQLRRLYQSSDIFALPSHAEGLPVVLMEAMAMELPCVATAIAGMPELIESGTNGLLVAPGNAGELASALAKLMDDEGLRRRFGRAGRDKIVTDHDLSKNVAKLAAVFQKWI